VGLFYIESAENALSKAQLCKIEGSYKKLLTGKPIKIKQIQPIIKNSPV
jgi:hypothetical protein